MHKGVQIHTTQTNKQQKKTVMVGKTPAYTNKEISSEVKFAKWKTQRDRGRSKTVRKRERNKGFLKTDDNNSARYSFALKVKKIAS